MKQKKLKFKITNNKITSDINQNLSPGFTLIEILLVVAIIAILAGIVIFAINPPKQLANSRNAQRRSDVNEIVNAIHQYVLDNAGSFPSGLKQNESCSGFNNNEICKTDASDCANLSDLSALTTNQKYLVAMPADPNASGSNNTGYFASRNSNNRITVCAPNAEEGSSISVTR